MALCPKTLKGCCDDLCYGGSCLLLPGISPLVRCDGCGQLTALNGDPEFDECECALESWPDYDEWPDESIGVPTRPGVLPKD